MLLAPPWPNDINGHTISHLMNLMSHSCSHCVDRWSVMLMSKNHATIGFWIKFTQSIWYDRQFVYKKRRMPQGTRLTELEQGKTLAYKGSGMSIHQIAKTISRSRVVSSNFLRDPNCYVSKKKRGIRRNISEKTKRRLLRAASNQITSTSKLKRSMELNYQC